MWGICPPSKGGPPPIPPRPRLPSGAAGARNPSSPAIHPRSSTSPARLPHSPSPLVLRNSLSGFVHSATLDVFEGDMAMFFKHLYILAGMAILAAGLAFSQSISGGTVSGTVADPSGAVIVHAKVVLRNPVTGYEQTATTGADGSFRFNNIPPNPYALTASAHGFADSSQQLDVHGSLPMTVNVSLSVAGSSTAVTVEAYGAAVETDPSAHDDVDRSSFLRLPSFDPAGQLSQAVTYSTGGGGGRRQRLFPPAGRPRPDQLRHRRAAHRRPAEQDLLHADTRQRDSVDGAHYGLARTRSTATSPAWS